MIFAIDKLFDKGIVSGWAVSNNRDLDTDFRIDIFTPIGKIFSGSVNLYRPDVQAHGISKTCNCGFSFDMKSSGIKDGDFVFLRIYEKNLKLLRTHSFVFGKTDFSKKEFFGYETPREDFSIMESSTSDILSCNNHILAFKLLLIRLRRYKRARLWRGNFKGVNYEYYDSDLNLFKKIATNYREAIFSSLSTRDLFSIIDTFADFSSEGESLAALSISLMMVYERFSTSLFLIYDKIKKEDQILNKQIPVWGGMLSNNLYRDDSLDIFLTRTSTLLKDYPHLLSYFYEIIDRAMKESNSLFSENISNSEYFLDAWMYYKSKFKEDSRLLLSSIEY